MQSKGDKVKYHDLYTNYAGKSVVKVREAGKTNLVSRNRVIGLIGYRINKNCE